MLFAIIIVIVILLASLYLLHRGESNTSHGYYNQRFFPRTSSGEAFEIQIERMLAKLEKAGARVIRDCYLTWSNGNTTQIDNILIFRSGIYVIECKDYSGWIFGTSYYDNWTQTLRSGWQGDSIKNRFPNPIKQNQKHIECIRQKILYDRSIPIHNIIVFGDNCTFKDIENDSEAYVIKARQLYEAIYRIEQETGNWLSQADIENIYTRLSEDVDETPNTRIEHMKYVNQIKEQKRREEEYDGDTCLRCGSPLVLRHGQYGSFYGCLRYPSCKYTRNV